MNDTRLHALAEDYLARLEAAAQALPDGERHELVAELRGHLAAGLEQNSSDAAVRNLLQDLGSPEDVVAAAAFEREGAGPYSVPRHHVDGSDRQTSPWGMVEIVAVLGLTVGTFVIPILGPVVGLCFAWASTRWTRREKAVATILTLLPALVLALGATVSTQNGPSRPVQNHVPQQTEARAS
jgi:uncharacterized membrane protein